MGHEDKGHYAEKHSNKEINETIAKKLKALSSDHCLGCASAHQAGTALTISPAKIGVQIDLLEYRIIECQLGLFGYSDGGKKINPDIDIAPDLNRQLDTAAKDGRISCLDCWNIAKNLKIKRLDVGSACEKKISK